MLVLNTNEQGNSGEVLSNSMIRAYPDFKSLLFYPNFTGILGISNYPSGQAKNGENLVLLDTTTKKSFEVNGTPVAISNQILQENILLNGTLTGGDLGEALYINYGYPHGGYSKNVSSDTNFDGSCYHAIRVGFSDIFQESGIVGKKSTLNLGFFVRYNSVSGLVSGMSVYFSLEYRLGILHSDGSITYGDWLSDDSLKSPAYTYNDDTLRYWGTSAGIAENETNGLNYIKGDRLIIEIGCRVRYIWSGNAGSTFGNSLQNCAFNVYFGKRGCTGDYVNSRNARGTTDYSGSSYLGTSTFRGRPIQISIE